MPYKGMLKKAIFVITFLCTFYSWLYSADPVSTSQTFTISVSGTNGIVILGRDPVFDVNRSDIGKWIDYEQDELGFEVTIFDIGNKRITASLDEDLPKGVEMMVYLAAPTDARSTGFQNLSVVERDVLRDITENNHYEFGKIIYRLRVSRIALQYSTFSRNVIYTMMDQ